MKRAARILIIGIACFGVLAISATTIENGPFAPDKQRPVAIEAPKPPDVVALGRIEPVGGVVAVSGPLGTDAGRIAQVVVAEGDWVEAGVLLATLDTRPRLEATLAQAKATLAMREAVLARISADLENQDKTLAAALEQQKAQRDRAKWDFDKLKQLQKSGLYKDPVLTDKRLALEAAEAALGSAELTLERNRKRDANGKRIDEVSQEAEIASAAAAVDKAAADLAFSEIRAPIAGRVLSLRGRTGQQIANEGLLDLADTRSMQVRAEVFETDLGKIGIGAMAKLGSRVLESPLSGRVTQIGRRINRQSIVGDDQAASIDARVVEVLVLLDDASTKAVADFTGLQVRVEFETGLKISRTGP
jgi:HlyD family secretion protein